MKPVRYTQHARQRMAARNVSVREVEKVMRTRAIDVPAKKGRRRATDTVEGRPVSVVYRETGDRVLIVKVY